MRRLGFNLAITLLLLFVLIATGVTGLLADYLGVPRSLFHRYSAYILMILAAWHIVLNRRQLWFRFKTAIQMRRRPVPAPERTGARPSEQPRAPALPWRTFLISGAAGIAGFFLGRWLPLRRLSSDLDETDLGLLYDQWSKPGLVGILRVPFQWRVPPPLYKEYPSAQRIPLSRDFRYRGLFVEESIQQRRSIRNYSGESLTMDQFSLLLHSAYAHVNRLTYSS